PYFETLKCLVDADALLVPGSQDPKYTASKIYPYILARKPLLAIFHEHSSVVDVLRQTGAGTVITFDSGETVGVLSDKIYRDWFLKPDTRIPDTNWTQFENYAASEMARQLC